MVLLEGKSVAQKKEEELLKTLLECTSIDCSSVIEEYKDWFIEEFKKEAKE